MSYTIGSLFTGYGGLDIGVAEALNEESKVLWCSDVAPGPRKVLPVREPDAPNLGDITQINWCEIEPVDVLVGGSPCQDLSLAGRRAGMHPGTRSGLWESMLGAINILRPHLIVWENVYGALSASAFSLLESSEGHLGVHGGGSAIRALGRVLGDLASYGYDAWWTIVRASDVGAPHRRARLFLAASDSNREPWYQRWQPMPSKTSRGRTLTESSGRSGKELRLLPTPTSSQMDGRKSPGFSGSGSFYDIVHGGRPGIIPYIRGIVRWEKAFREAPYLTDDNGRLSTSFVEWMMGLPEEWVTAPELGLSRREQLQILGNGVVPQQATYAIRILAEIAEAVKEGE